MNQSNPEKTKGNDNMELDSFPIYSVRCLALLRKAQKQVEMKQESKILRYCFHRISSVNDSDESGDEMDGAHNGGDGDDNNGSLSSSSPSSSESENDEAEKDGTTSNNTNLMNVAIDENKSSAGELMNQSQNETHEQVSMLPIDQAQGQAPTGKTKKKKSKGKNKKNAKERQRDQFIQSLGKPVSAEIPTGDDDQVVELPSALLSKTERQSGMETITKAYADLATKLGPEKREVIVLLLRSGRFAAGVFRHDKCLQHTVSLGMGGGGA